MKLLLGFVFASTAFSQSAPTFEVASVKPAAGVGRGGGISMQPGGRMSAHAPLHFLIQFAYRVKASQVMGGPASINTDSWDIIAKAETGPTRPPIPDILQALLADRFKLTLHRETKELPVYFLLPAKGGMKLPAWQEGSCVTSGQNTPPPSPGQAPRLTCGSRLFGPTGFNAPKIGTTQLADSLSMALDRVVIDNTGSTGTFDVHLEFAADQATAALAGPGGAPPTGDSGTPSIFTALQEQLGLKLDSGKAPVEILVIDHAEKPDEN